MEIASKFYIRFIERWWSKRITFNIGSKFKPEYPFSLGISVDIEGISIIATIIFKSLPKSSLDLRDGAKCRGRRNTKSRWRHWSNHSKSILKIEYFRLKKKRKTNVKCEQKPRRLRKNYRLKRRN